MKPAVFSDWNMTLINERDDKPALKQIAMDELKYCAARPWKWGSAKRLASLKGKMELMIERYREDPEAGEKLLRASYDIYGSEVIPGMTRTKILNSLHEYASGAVKRLDPAFYELCRALEGEVLAVIMTTALDDGVHEVALRAETNKPILLVDGSRIEYKKGIATGFEMRNYNDKHVNLEKNLTNDMLVSSGERTVFMGNDFRDEPCAELVDIFVVAPLATDEYRQRMASKYGTKVRTPSAKKGEVYKALILD